MQTITTIGLDIAKSVFQVHGVDNDGKVVIRRQLKRRYVLAFFEEAAALRGRHRGLCLVTPLVTRVAGTWRYRTVDAADLRQALTGTAEERCGRRRGHLRGGHKNQYAVCASQDARASKRADAPSHAPSVHPAADLGDQCDPGSPCRVLGVTAAVGRKGIEELLRVIADPSDKLAAEAVAATSFSLGSQLLSLKKQILDFDRMIMAWHRSNQTGKRLNCIPGVGPLLATALVASVNSTRAAVGIGSAVSANRGIAICAACSWPAHSLSFAMPRSTAPSIGPGSQRC